MMTNHSMSCHCKDCTRYIPPEDIGALLHDAGVQTTRIFNADEIARVFSVTADGIVRPIAS